MNRVFRVGPQRRESDLVNPLSHLSWLSEQQKPLKLFNKDVENLQEIKIPLHPYSFHTNGVQCSPHNQQPWGSGLEGRHVCLSHRYQPG